MNIGTLFVLMIVAALAGNALRIIVNDRKQGKASCGCSIGGCSCGCGGCTGCSSHTNEK